MRTAGGATCNPQHVISELCCGGCCECNLLLPQPFSAPGWTGCLWEWITSCSMISSPICGWECQGLGHCACICICKSIRVFLAEQAFEALNTRMLCKGMCMHGHELEAAPSQGFPGHVWTCRYWCLWYPHTAAGGSLFPVAMETRRQSQACLQRT